MGLDEAALNRLTEGIIGAAIDVHRELGPGLLESVYESAMRIELGLRGTAFESQRVIPVRYKGEEIGEYRADLIVAEAVVVELKSVSALEGIHEAQLLTYMRLTGCPIGLLINFNVPKLLNGIKRMRL